MARPSYLQRIASPLAAGEPVLVPVPGPAPGEGRPAARGGGTAPDVAPEAAKPTLPRASARNIAGPAAGPVPTQAQAGAPTAVLVAGALPPTRPADAAPQPLPGQQTVAEWIAPRDAVQDFPLARRPVAPSVTAGPTLEWGAPVKFRAMPAIAPAPQNQMAPAPAKATMAQSHASTLAITPGVAVTAPRAAEPTGFAEPAPWARPQAQASGPAAAAPVADPAAPPRIHIGTIEVRTSPAPAAPPQPAPPLPSSLNAPAAPPGAAGRGYGWRYGLSQG
jgi:hypothetical protein